MSNHIPTGLLTQKSTSSDLLKPIIIKESLNPCSLQNKKKQQLQATSSSSTTTSNMDPMTEAEAVDYLRQHPSFLTDYIVKNVDYVTLYRWMARRNDCARSSTHRPSLTHRFSKFSARQTATISPDIMKQIMKRPSSLQIVADITSPKVKSIESATIAESEALLISQLFRESVLQSIRVDIGYIYMTNPDKNSIALLDPAREEGRKHIKMIYQIGDKRCTAALAAVEKEIIIKYFPEDADLNRIHHPKGTFALMAVPLTREDGSLVSVVELYRYLKNEPFLHEDRLYAEHYAQWARATLTFSDFYNESIERQRVHGFILQVAQNLLTKIATVEEVMLDIVSYAKALARADRGALFLLNDTKTLLETRIMDSADGKKMLVIQKKGKQFFSIEQGIVGYVARSGKSENLINVKNDPRFDPQVDSRPNYDAESLLCVPVKVKDETIGVMQMLNSSQGYFTNDNEEHFRTFAVYCGLAIHVASMYEANIKSQQQCRATLEVMSLHTQCSEAEVKALKKQPLPRSFPKITSFSYSPWTVPHEQKVVHVIFMFQDLFSVNGAEFGRWRATWLRFDMNTVLRFVLTVRKNYRAVPYHNWDHALAVNQAAYVILKKCCKSRFALEEEIAMFIGALCHDIDHRGKSNQFMINNKSPLASLYATSTMEQHHFNLTVTILQRDGHNIFQMLSSHRYRIILDLIKHCILSTDLGLFCTSLGQDLMHRLQFGPLDFTNKVDRTLLISNCMTACDLSAMYKPWNIQFTVVLIIMKEFWLEGDEEKRNGRTPVPMMDRDYRHLLPECQVDFIYDVCLPCFSNIALVFPEYGQVVKFVKNNLSRWEALKVMDESDRLKKLAEMELKIVDLKRNLVTAEKHSTRQSLYFANIPSLSSENSDETTTYSSDSID